jgi:hypothetical protein
MGGSQDTSLRALFENRHHVFGLAHYTIDASNQSLVETCNQLRDRLTPAA